MRVPFCWKLYLKWKINKKHWFEIEKKYKALELFLSFFLFFLFFLILGTLNMYASLQKTNLKLCPQHCVAWVQLTMIYEHFIWLVLHLCWVQFHTHISKSNASLVKYLSKYRYGLCMLWGILFWDILWLLVPNKGRKCFSVHATNPTWMMHTWILHMRHTVSYTLHALWLLRLHCNQLCLPWCINILCKEVHLFRTDQSTIRWYPFFPTFLISYYSCSPRRVSTKL